MIYIYILWFKLWFASGKCDQNCRQFDISTSSASRKEKSTEILVDFQTFLLKTIWNWRLQTTAILFQPQHDNGWVQNYEDIQNGIYVRYSCSSIEIKTTEKRIKNFWYRDYSTLGRFQAGWWTWLLYGSSFDVFAHMFYCGCEWCLMGHLVLSYSMYNELFGTKRAPSSANYLVYCLLYGGEYLI